jgi:hypothetical protein
MYGLSLHKCYPSCVSITKKAAIDLKRLTFGITLIQMYASYRNEINAAANIVQGIYLKGKSNQDAHLEV